MAGSVEGLVEELEGIDGEIEAAALREDAASFTKLLMRRKALPHLIASLRAQPIRREISGLEAELEELGHELERARREPPPPAREGARTVVNATMAKNGRLSSVTSRMSAVGRRLDGKKAELAEIVGAGTA